MFPRVAENNSPGKKLASRVEADRKGLFVQTPPHTSAGSSRASSNGPRVKYKLNMTPLEIHTRLSVLKEISELYMQTGPLDAALYAVRQQRTDCCAHFFTWRSRRITRTSAACCHPVDRNGQHSSLTLKLYCTEETLFCSCEADNVLNLLSSVNQIFSVLIMSDNKSEKTVHSYPVVRIVLLFCAWGSFLQLQIRYTSRDPKYLRKHICLRNYYLIYYFHPCQDFDEFVSENKVVKMVLSACNIKCCWYIFYIFYSLLFLTFFF